MCRLRFRKDKDREFVATVQIFRELFRFRRVPVFEHDFAQEWLLALSLERVA